MMLLVMWRHLWIYYQWNIRIRGHCLQWFHVAICYATYLMVRYNVDMVTYNFIYRGLGRVAESVPSVQHQIMLIPSFVAPLCGFATMSISWFIQMRSQIESDAAEERIARRMIDLQAMLVIMPFMFAAHALKAQIHILASVTNSKSVPSELEESACTADLMLGHVFQYMLVRSFLGFCEDVLRKADPDVMAQTIKVGIPFMKAFDKERPIGNLEIFVLNMYVVFGLCLTLVLFGGVIAVDLHNLCRYKQEVAQGVHAFRNQLAPTAHVSTVLVFVSSQLLLQREAIHRAMPNASKKWSASRWLLMAPLQLTALTYVMTMDWARLMHSSLLAFECLAVVVHNVNVILKEKNSCSNGDTHKALLG